jgi:GNAT superfamily N-acetyltransferase
MRSLVSTRRATVDDIDVLFATVQAGFDSYVEFAPAGWEPPSVPADRARSVRLLEHPATWSLMAFSDGRPVGHVAFFPAYTRQTGRPPTEGHAAVEPRGVAHLWQLFVLPAWWGQGIAALLHDAALTEMRARGYRAARLFTPSLHSRARRFYERRGWLAGDDEWSNDLGLNVIEYRLAFDSSRPPPYRPGSSSRRAIVAGTSRGPHRSASEGWVAAAALALFEPVARAAVDAETATSAAVGK